MLNAVASMRHDQHRLRCGVFIEFIKVDAAFADVALTAATVSAASRSSAENMAFILA